MKNLLIFLVFSFIFLESFIAPKPAKFHPIFDKKTFKGWEGDTISTWHIENGMIMGGSLEKTVSHNQFLCTKKQYTNFILKLKIKLAGNEGFINSGIQFRSKRLANPAYEMEGYQADWGKGYWASLYDESRRNKTLIGPDTTQIKSWIKINDWNNYEVRAMSNKIMLFINGHQTVNYTETDPNISQTGKIGVQIHGGGKALVAFKDIYIKELP